MRSAHRCRIEITAVIEVLDVDQRRDSPLRARLLESDAAGVVHRHAQEAVVELARANTDGARCLALRSASAEWNGHRPVTGDRVEPDRRSSYGNEVVVRVMARRFDAVVFHSPAEHLNAGAAAETGQHDAGSSGANRTCPCGARPDGYVGD